MVSLYLDLLLYLKKKLLKHNYTKEEDKKHVNSGSKKTSITALRLCFEPLIYKSKHLDSKRFVSLVLDAFLKPIRKCVVFFVILNNQYFCKQVN